MDKIERDRIASFIFQQKYRLRQACVHYRKWRQKIALVYLERKIGTSDQFIEVWGSLEEANLIYPFKRVKVRR